MFFPGILLSTFCHAVKFPRNSKYGRKHFHFPCVILLEKFERSVRDRYFDPARIELACRPTLHCCCCWLARHSKYWIFSRITLVRLVGPMVCWKQSHLCFSNWALGKLERRRGANAWISRVYLRISNSITTCLVSSQWAD